MADEAKRQRRSESVYLLQVREDGHDDAGAMARTYRWRDVAMLTVPAGTKRRTLLAKAMEEDGQWEFDASGKAVLRVIPAEHAASVTVEWEQPPPRLKIA